MANPLGICQGIAETGLLDFCTAVTNSSAKSYLFSLACVAWQHCLLARGLALPRGSKEASLLPLPYLLLSRPIHDTAGRTVCLFSACNDHLVLLKCCTLKL